MKLSTNQKKVLSAIQLNANASVSKLAKATGLQQHSVAYAIKTLQENQLITFTPYIDIYPLGFTDFGLFFSATSSKKFAYERIMKSLTNSRRVSWIAEFSGDLQFGVSFIGRHISELDQFIYNLRTESSITLFRKSVAPRIVCSYFPSKYLNIKQKQTNTYLTCHSNTSLKPVSIDLLDHSILAELCRSTQFSLAALSRKIGTSESTIAYRIKKLEEKKVILGYVYRIFASDIFMDTYRLLVFERGSPTPLRDDLFEFCKNHPNVVGLVQTLGNWDYEVTVEVADAKQMIQINRELMDTFPVQIHSIKTLNLLTVHRRTYYPFKDFIELDQAP